MIMQFRDHRTGEFREALRGDDRADAALATPCAHVGQRGDTQAARFGIASGRRHMRCEQMGFVDANQHRMRPMFASGGEQPREEGGGLLDPMIGFKIGEIKMQRNAVLARAQRKGGKTVIGIISCDNRRGADMRGEIGELSSGSTMMVVR